MPQKKSPFACLIAAILSAASIQAEIEAPIPDQENTSCFQKKSEDDHITWKKFFLYAGVCVIGILTFTATLNLYKSLI